jgi:hypothetical protein
MRADICVADNKDSNDSQHLDHSSKTRPAGRTHLHHSRSGLVHFAHDVLGDLEAARARDQIVVQEQRGLLQCVHTTRATGQ